MKTKATRPPHPTLRCTRLRRTSAQHAVLAPLAALLLCAIPARAALIGYWTFDEGTGTSAADSSGVGTPHTGTLATGGTGARPAWIAGRFGSALDFNRVDNNNGSRVTVPNQTDLWFNDAFTISFWYRPGPNVGTFPGPMRIGSQSSTTTDLGWGFFRNMSGTTPPRTMVYKRGNAQPGGWPVAMVNGQWYHVVLRHDGVNANLCVMSGVSTQSVTQAWADANSVNILEFGRMDQFDDCDLDDIAFFNEALPTERIATIYSVPTNLGLDYNLGNVRSLWAIFDAGPGSSGVVKGLTWSHTATLPGTHVAGEAFIVGADLYVAMTASSGVRATVTSITGTYSPGGVGAAASVEFTPSPFTFNIANLVFDLNSATTQGSGVNDLITVTTDMNVTTSTIAVNPLAPLANGTYRLMNYGGVKSGSFSPTVGHNTRYSFVLDESTGGQVNATVSGVNANVKWTSTTNANWDLTTTNWQNTDLSGPDRFYQADNVRFDDSGPYVTNINLTTSLYPGSLTIDSAVNYTFNGGTIGGAGNGLVKNGAGSLTFNSIGTYIGPVTINNGLFKMGTATALGTAASGTTIAPGATLDLGGFSPGPTGAEAVTVGGAGLNSTGAVINTGASLVNTGLRGGVTLTGDTTFGGINRWDVFGGTFVGGGYKLTKTGPPEIALSNLGDTGLGDIDVLQGQLTILGSTTMGDSSKPVTIFPGATLAHWSSGANIHNKPLAMTSARILNATSGNTDVATNIGAVSLTGTNTVDGGSSVALLGEVSGTGALTKVGSGTLHLGGANTYAGRTTVSAGTLALAGSGSVASTSIFVAGGATLNAATRTDGTLTLASGQTLSGSGTVRGNLAAGTGAAIVPGTSAGTLTVTNELSLSDGAMLTYELNTSTNEGSGINDLINVGGPLTLSGTTTLKILPIGTLVTDTPYTLINYVGALTAGGDNFTVTTDSRLTLTVDTTTTPGKVQLTASGAAETLEWTGGDVTAPTAWDIKTTPNWVGSIVPDIFYAGDTVLFDDFGAEFNVSLVGDLYPGNTRVEAAENDYTFTGSGRIRGGGLNKSLAGKLTIANSGVNDYPAPTVINGGTIQLGDGGTVGNLGPNVITNNGTLSINRSDDLTFANVMVGSGVLRKEGANTLTLPNLLSNFSGSIVVNGGIIKPTATNGVGNLIGGTTINPGATLDLNALNLDLEAVTVSGAGAGGIGALVNNSATAQQNAFRSVTLAGDTTVGGVGRWDIRNPGAGATLTGAGFALTKIGANQVSLVNLGETDLGDINVVQGTLSVEVGSTMGRPANTATVGAGATLMWWGATVVQNKQIALNNGGRLFKDNGNSTNLGPMSLSVTGIVDVANNSGAELTLKGPITGTGTLIKNGAGNLNLTANNTYSGPTIINAGILQLGEGTDTGSILGDIVTFATLSVRRTNLTTLANNITGTGGIFIRSTNGVIIEGPGQINIGGGIEVGRDIYGKLIVRDGANPVMGRMLVGNIANTPGDVIQQGGNVYVTLDARVGHWPTETSTYLLGGGTFNVTNLPTGVVNPTGTPEQNGILYIGVDGTGIFTQTGGVATAHGIVLDARGNTAGTDTFAMEGGTFNIGPSGIKSGSLDANTTYQIYLGGGTLFSSANWTSTLAMTLTGTNGDVTIDTAANTVTLNGVLSGPGGLQKTGAGTLRLNRASTFAGTLAINQGTLSGTGAISGPLIVAAGGTLAPGLSIGTFTASGTVTLAGTTVMEINKTGATPTSDLLTGVTTLNYGGTLNVVATGDPLASGDTFNLFDAATFESTFAVINLPPLPSGLLWQNRLRQDGTIRVASQPQIASTTLSGTSLTLSGTNGVPNAGYSVRSSTDLATPLASWTEVATGNFDASGNFSVTLTVSESEEQRFYVILVP